MSHSAKIANTYIYIVININEIQLKEGLFVQYVPWLLIFSFDSHLIFIPIPSNLFSQHFADKNLSVVTERNRLKYIIVGN